MTDKRVVLTTCGSLEEARTLAQALVQRQLAACVNIIPQIESIYRWKGDMETATEWMLLIKTTAEAFDRIQGAIRELHSYEVPECVELAIRDGSEAYLNWIAESVR
jgi:periplasmic divalent cation tolerance protein